MDGSPTYPRLDQAVSESPSADFLYVMRRSLAPYESVPEAYTLVAYALWMEQGLWGFECDLERLLPKESLKAGYPDMFASAEAATVNTWKRNLNRFDQAHEFARNVRMKALDLKLQADLLMAQRGLATLKPPDDDAVPWVSRKKKQVQVQMQEKEP